MISSQVFQLPPSVLWHHKTNLCHTAYAVFWHLDVLEFWQLFLFAITVFQAQVEKTPQLRAELALQQSLSAAGFQPTLTEVQGQSRICSRTHRVLGSTRITSQPQCLRGFLFFTLSCKMTLCCYGKDWVLGSSTATKAFPMGEPTFWPREFGFAWCSGWLFIFVFILLSLLERERVWKTNMPLRHPEEITELLPVCAHWWVFTEQELNVRDMSESCSPTNLKQAF